MLLKIIAIGIEYYGYSHAVLFYMKWIMSDVDAKLHSWIIDFLRYEIYWLDNPKQMFSTLWVPNQVKNHGK